MAKRKSAPAKTARLRIGVVTARFNQEITFKLRDGAHRVIEKGDREGTPIELWSVEVPGAIEIPLAVQMLLKKGCDGVVALGAVIRGETPHFEYVNQSVERALTQLILDFKRPVGFGVLTVENWQQAEERVGGKHGHKGEEAAQAVLEMVGLRARISRATKPSELLYKSLGTVAAPGSAIAKRQRRP